VALALELHVGGVDVAERAQRHALALDGGAALAACSA